MIGKMLADGDWKDANNMSGVGFVFEDKKTSIRVT